MTVGVFFKGLEEAERCQRWRFSDNEKCRKGE